MKRTLIVLALASLPVALLAQAKTAAPAHHAPSVQQPAPPAADPVGTPLTDHDALIIMTADDARTHAHADASEKAAEAIAAKSAATDADARANQKISEVYQRLGCSDIRPNKEGVLVCVPKPASPAVPANVQPTAATSPAPQ